MSISPLSAVSGVGSSPSANLETTPSSTPVTDADAQTFSEMSAPDSVGPSTLADVMELIVKNVMNSIMTEGAELRQKLADAIEGKDD